MLPAPQPATEAFYQEASFVAEGADDDLADDVYRIVDIEGPVHGDEIVARLRTVRGWPRLTPRLRAAIDEGLGLGLGRGLLQVNDGFYAVPGRDAPVRDRTRVSAGLRKPDMLPPAEIDRALLLIVTENYGAARAELIPAVARRLGFSTTAPALKARIEEGISRLLASGGLIDREGLLLSAE